MPARARRRPAVLIRPSRRTRCQVQRVSRARPRWWPVISGIGSLLLCGLIGLATALLGAW